MDEKRQALSTVREVIDAFGGPTALTEWVNSNVEGTSITKSAVTNWHIEGWIPPAWFLAISTELKIRGYDVEPKVFRQLPVRTDA
jgi:hypothetical protein